MGKDPAFLFYPGDWLGGTMGMTLEQKGAYLELLIFQFNNGAFTEAQAKQVLSICLPSVWQVLSKKFTFDPASKTFSNTRLTDEIKKRQKFTESRRNNAKGVKAYAQHMENENRNENKDINTNGVEFENYQKWTNDIIDGTDHVFEQSFMNEGLKLTPETFVHLVRDHLGLLERYPKMKPPDQQRFRGSCLKHIRENHNKKSNGKPTDGEKLAAAHVRATDYAAGYKPKS